MTYGSVTASTASGNAQGLEDALREAVARGAISVAEMSAWRRSNLAWDFESAVIEAMSPLRGLVRLIQQDTSAEGPYPVGDLLQAAIEKAERRFDELRQQLEDQGLPS